MLGFLLGVTFAGAVGYYYLLEGYNTATASLLRSVKELQESTEKAQNYPCKGNEVLTKVSLGERLCTSNRGCRQGRGKDKRDCRNGTATTRNEDRVS